MHRKRVDDNMLCMRREDMDVLRGKHSTRHIRVDLLAIEDKTYSLIVSECEVRKMETEMEMLWDVPSMSNSTYSMFLVGGIFIGRRRGTSRRGGPLFDCSL